jgi:TRAP-type C4-dicarboxylate transport system substrate-binding protein
MGKVSSLRRWALRWIAVSIGAGLAGAAPAQEFTLRVAHFLPPASTAHARFIAPWCEKIARESNQRLRCQIYPSMQLGGSPPQLFDQVRDGVADIVWTLPGYTAGRFPSVEVFELPFMTNNAQAASRALWEYYTRHAVKDFEAVKPLAFHTHDQGYIHTRERPIRTLADFKGLKMRAPTRQTNKMLAAFGATPVSMPVPALAEALSKGVVDGCVIPWEVMPSIKAHEMVRFHSETDPASRALYTAVFLFAMNKASYDRLPADLRGVIDANSGLELSGWIGSIWDASAPPARKLAVDRGNTIYTIPAAELARWEKAAAPLFRDWVDEMNRRGADGQALLDDARALIEKHSRK